jgi:prevent-host-death family protein
VECAGLACCSYTSYIGAMNVGTRELKNRLSHYLRRVRASGEPIYVTDRGEVIAELRPIRAVAGRSENEILAELARKGDVSPGAGRFEDFKPIKPRHAISVSRLVLEDR